VVLIGLKRPESSKLNACMFQNFHNKRNPTKHDLLLVKMKSKNVIKCIAITKR
jgi:hypothetical protein